MRTILVAFLATIVTADVSHLVNQQPSSGYQYPSAVPESNPLSSYGAPQSSVVGDAAPSTQYSNVASPVQYALPSASGPSVEFVNRFSAPIPSGPAVQTFYSVSNPSLPSAEVSSFQVSTPAPSVQVSTASPSVSSDFSGFQVSSPSPSPPSVNFVQYSQQPNSYQFLSSLSQPTVSIPTFGISTPGAIGGQYSSDASLNSGVSVNSNSDVGVQTSGGSINDAFGVATDAATGAEASADAEVTKKLYFFAAPQDEEEGEEIQAKIDLPQTPPKQTYKIIFIKAPTYRSKATITVPAPVPNQERTLVYVLVKKPEVHPTVRFQPSGAAPEAPKPEVFFIRYKTQKEAEAAVAEIQSKHGASGEIIANLAAGNHNAEGTPVSIGESDFRSAHVDTPVNNVVVSTPAPANFGSRISETVNQQQPETEVNQPGFEVPAGRGGYAPEVTPVTFGQNAVDAHAVFGAGIASDRSDQEIESGNVANLSTVLIGGSSAPSEEESTSTTFASTEASTDQESQNLLSQRVGGEGEAQSSQVVGFSAYGPPRF